MEYKSKPPQKLIHADKNFVALHLLHIVPYGILLCAHLTENSPSGIYL